MFSLARWCAILCAALAAPVSAQAQNPSSYPDRPIRLVVAFPPGGATDTLTRQITQELGEALGQSVVIENKPGAGGYVAWNHVATSDPDGYTLLMAENAIGISQALYKKSSSSFDPVTQYDAIATVATSPLVLAVANNVKANTVAELIAYSRTVPQKMNYASAGIGSVSHLTFEVIKAGTGMEAVHVPYKGGGPAMNDVIAGHVAINMASIQVAKGLVEARQDQGACGHQHGPFTRAAQRSDPERGRHQDRGRGFALLVRNLRSERHSGCRQEPSWTRRFRPPCRIRACANGWPSSISSRPTHRAAT